LFPFFLLPLFIRCWIFNCKFYITRARYQGVSADVIIKKVWLLRPSSITICWLFLFFIQILIPIIFSIPSHLVGWKVLPSDFSCDNISTIFLQYSLTVIYLIAVLVSVIFLWPSRDAYYIKSELRFTLYFWVIFIIPPWLAASLESTSRFAYYFPSLSFVMLGMYGNFLVSGVLIYWQSRKTFNFDEGNRFDLKNLLLKPHFRRQFEDFLCLQLSIENLQFFDAVQQFKVSEPTLELARSIFAKFIEPGSEFEVNISGSTLCGTRDKLAEAAVDNSTMCNVFDTAEDEVYSLLIFHSLPVFWHHVQFGEDETLSKRFSSSSSSFSH